MNVRELIEVLSGLPPDLLVVHSTGTMQDRGEVTGYVMGEPGQTAWTADIKYLQPPWIELL